ncbi:MAG: 6-phosphofructo-2-kinase/fructose-2,6-bisphosphatase [Myxococcota bacterium]
MHGTIQAYTALVRTLASDDSLVLVMVGLPARGKTYLARKTARYLNWLGRPARVFNVGNYRRSRLGSAQPASFFDPDNPGGVAARRDLALAALDDLVAWLGEAPGRVAIYDATNATRARRDLVVRRLAEAGLAPVFVESVCTDPAIVEANVRETKVSMPDYAGADPDAAVADFRARIAHYERSYEPVDEDDRSWVKLVDVGRRVVHNRIQGYLASHVAFFLANLHITPRPIYLTRHGESAFNVVGRIGGDARLSERGRAFARHLGAWLPERIDGTPQVWTSTLLRTIETARALPWPAVALKNLDEIDAGVYDGWTYGDIEATAPAEAAARAADKLRYRYPRGESYEDVISRLDPVIIELERQREPVVVVAHQAVLRCLYAYFVDLPAEDCPRVDVPLHTVIELVPKAYGAAETRHPIGT